MLVELLSNYPTKRLFELEPAVLADFLADPRGVGAAFPTLEAQARVEAAIERRFGTLLDNVSEGLVLTQKALVFGETTVPAGAYTLYLVPSETGATQLAISTHIGKWGVPVDEKNDLARVPLTKGTLETSVDQLTLALDKNPDDTGTLKIMWEKTVYSVGFSVKK